MATRNVSFAEAEDPEKQQQQQQQQQQQSQQRAGCPNCGSKAIEHHEASGASICTECGIVVEENAIVSSIEFDANSSMMGKFVSATSSRAFSAARRPGFSRDSRETTLANGRRKIQDVASRLRLPGHFVDAAHRLYTIAVEKNFVRGRRSAHVIAACLYIACRQEKSQQMLIDFSDALAVNVYSLGTCFLKFRRLLGLKLEIVDPALYVYRFAAHLDLNEKANQVSLTALRLVARMKRDWIVAGRRPAGICAAALLIASRAHGFQRQHQDVTKILRVCGMTVQTRVKEFERTDTARLTLDQFHESDLLREADPPVFTQNRIQEARARAIEDGNVELLTSGALDAPGKKGSNWRTDNRLKPKEAEFQELYSSLEKELMEGSGTSGDKSTAGVLKEKDASEDAEASASKDLQKKGVNEEEGQETSIIVSEGGTSANDTGVSTALVVRDDSSHQEISASWKRAYPRRQNGKALVLPDHSTAEERQPSTAPVEAKLSLQDWKEDMPSSIDSEIDEMFRTDQEQHQMEVIFNQINKDYLVQQERKESDRLNAEAATADLEKQDAVQAAGHARFGNKSSGRGRKRKDQTTEEQLIAAMSNRKVSRKINYDALSSIFDDTGSFSTELAATDGGEEPGMFEML